MDIKAHVETLKHMVCLKGQLCPQFCLKFMLWTSLKKQNIEGIMKLKFADDGTFKISASTTEGSIEKLNVTLDTLNNWTRRWRMVINCLPNKTEIICSIPQKTNLTSPKSLTSVKVLHLVFLIFN